MVCFGQRGYVFSAILRFNGWFSFITYKFILSYIDFRHFIKSIREGVSFTMIVKCFHNGRFNEGDEEQTDYICNWLIINNSERDMDKKWGIGRVRIVHLIS